MSQYNLKFFTLSLTLSEEAIEEGEIVRESPVQLVVDGCCGVMGEVLSRLHSSACVPHLTPGQGEGVVGGSDLELVVGLQSGVEEWCDRLLLLCQQEDGDVIWYIYIYLCVCVCVCIHTVCMYKYTSSAWLRSFRIQFSLNWLQELISCVCICCSELQAAQAIAHLACNTNTTYQVI